MTTIMDSKINDKLYDCILKGSILTNRYAVIFIVRDIKLF